jgi:prepilin-type N-terminal cleavage/methylation domain-containing protein
MRNKFTKIRSGFTIVELLVSIAVVVILASISYIGYRNWQTVLFDTQIKTEVGSVASAMEDYNTFSGSYPASIPTTIAVSNGASKGGGSLNSGLNYCVNVYKSSIFKWYFASDRYKSALNGMCPRLYIDVGLDESYPGSGTTWFDLSGQANNGTFTGGVTFDSANGGSLSFDGTGYVTIPDPANGSLDWGTPNGDFTVGIWLKATAWGGDYRNLILKGSGTTSSWGVGLSTTGVPNVIIGDTVGSTQNNIGTTVMGANAWHYLAFSCQRSGNATAYIDGTSVGTLSISSRSGSADNANALVIGNSATKFNGKIGQIVIIDQARASTYVNFMFNASKSRYGL